MSEDAGVRVGMAAGSTSSSVQRRRWWWSLAAISAAVCWLPAFLCRSRHTAELPGDASWFHEAAASLAAGRLRLASGPSVRRTPATLLSGLGVLRPLRTRQCQCPARRGRRTRNGGRRPDRNRRTKGRWRRRRPRGRGAGRLEPAWFQSPGVLMSESLYLVAVPGVLALAFWCIDRPSFVSFGALGVVVAAAVLTRSDAIGLIVLLGIPTVLLATKEWVRRGVLAMALVAGSPSCSSRGWSETRSNSGEPPSARTAGSLWTVPTAPRPSTPILRRTGASTSGVLSSGPRSCTEMTLRRVPYRPTSHSTANCKGGRRTSLGRTSLISPGRSLHGNGRPGVRGTSTTNRRSPAPKVATHRGRQPAESWTGCSCPSS